MKAERSERLSTRVKGAILRKMMGPPMVYFLPRFIRRWRFFAMGDKHQARVFFFDHVENLDPIDGYAERPVSWFKSDVLPDILATTRRLHLSGRLGEYGCAYGYFTTLFAEHFASVVGIDFSAERIAGARKYHKAPNVTYEQADLTTPIEQRRLDFQLGRFDWAISSAVIQHLNPAQRRNAFQQIFCSLDSGSYLLLYDETFDKRPNLWDGFYEPISPTWITANLSDLCTLNACDYVCRGLDGEYIYRYELQKR